MDIVIANAGIMETKPFFDEDDVDENGDLKEPSQSHHVIDVNLKGTMNSMSTLYYSTVLCDQTIPAIRLAAHYYLSPSVRTHHQFEQSHFFTH